MRLVFERVGIRYGARQVFGDISLTLAKGEVLALLGPNAAGKSSLLRAAAGLQAHDGRIAREGFGRERIGFLPQDNGSRAALTVLETVLLGRLGALGMRVPEAEIARAIAALSRLGLAGLAQHFLPDLSGGQRQLVFLAQLLCADPAVLLLDEPTSALDLRNTLALLALLRRLAHEEGLAVVAALHDVNAAAGFADRIAVLGNGRLIALGRPEEVLTPALLAEVYGVAAELVVTGEGRRVIVPTAALETLPDAA